MKHRIVGLLGLSAMLAFTAQAQSSTIYTGFIGTSDGTIAGTEAWATGSSISWTVSQNLNGSWLYSYDFNVASKDISHFIIETCPNFDASDILIFSDPSDELGAPVFGTFTSTSNGSSNPGLPGSIYGFKIDTDADASALSLGFSFTSNHAPAWKDVYLKDGKQGGDNVYAFNSGFNLTDPVALPSNGSLNGHILAPGCDVIPEPTSALLAMLGALGFLRRRR